MVLFAALTFGATALAAPESVRLDADAAALHDRLMLSFDAHFNLNGASLDADQHGPACLTNLVKELHENWALFTPAEKAEMSARLTPWAEDLTAPFADEPAPPPATGSPCFSVSSYTKTLNDPDNHFQVQWSGTTISDSTAQDFLDALVHAYEVEIGELGWRAPAGASKYPMPVFVANDSRSAGAYTYIDYCSGTGYLPYIVAYSGSFYGGSWYEDMAAHEFNHASQFAYTNVTGSINKNVDFWWWEATATYVQESVNPSYNWWSQYTTGYSDNPYVSMHASDQSDNTIFWHMYGMATWAFYLDNHVGGLDVVQGTWDYAATDTSRRLDMTELISAIDLDFEEIYRGFMAVNTVMDYDEHRYFGDIDLTEEVDALPASGEPSSRKKPQGHGQNYIKFDKDLGDSDQPLKIVFDGDSEVEWFVLLVEPDGRTVEGYTELEVDSDGHGEVTYDFSGDRDLYLVISPNTVKDDGYSYAWSAERVEVVEDTGGDDTAVVDDDTGEVVDDTGDDGQNVEDDGDGDKSSGCGCASGGSGGGAAALAFGLIGLATRRRRG